MKRIHRIFIIWAWALPLLVSAQDLAQYQAIAAQNNPDLQARYKTFEAALETVAQQSSLPDPQLSFGYFLSPVETRVGPQRARFSLSQMFPWFGTLKAQGKAASLRAEAQYQAFLDARNRLYYQVALAYYPLYEWQQHREREQENRRILKSMKKLAITQFRSGKGQMVDALRVDMQLNETQTKLEVLDQQEKALKTHFNQLLNRPAESDIQLPDTLVLRDISARYRRDSLLRNHPQLREMELMAKASKVRARAAQLQGMPRLGLGLDYALVAPRSGVSSPRNGQDALMPMMSLSLPIFRTKYQAAQKQAQLRQAQYRLQEEARENELRSSYQKVIFKVRKNRERVVLYQRQMATARQSLRLLRQAYSNSGQAFEELLRMQQQILQYQKLRASALADFYQELAQLNYVTHK